MEPIKVPERCRWLQINSAFKSWRDFIQKQVSALVLYKNPKLLSLYRFLGVIHIAAVFKWAKIAFSSQAEMEFYWILIIILLDRSFQYKWSTLKYVLLVWWWTAVKFSTDTPVNRGYFFLDPVPGWHFCIKWNILTTFRRISMKFGADVHGSQMTHPHFQSFYFPLTINVLCKKNGRRPWRTYRQTRRAYKTCNDP